MTLIRLRLTGENKENICCVRIMQNTTTLYRWGGENGNPFNAQATVAPGAYRVEFETDDAQNDEDLDISGASGTLTVEDNDETYDITFTPG